MEIVCYTAQLHPKINSQNYPVQDTANGITHGQWLLQFQKLGNDNSYYGMMAIKTDVQNR